MASKSVITSVKPTPSSERPRVTSYDSPYEYSLEHWLEVKQLVEAADQEAELKARLSAAAKAS